ncbi:MAG: zinc ribbon domain-containing protein [Dissulfurispiraceae bacterium]|nr:zinc ribbon domain-containing protein [Dissulfurispiraceae bacterium]
MPIYEFSCDKCSAEFSTIVQAADDKVVCPRCGSDEVSKLISPFSCGSGSPFDCGSM